jgi:hypothetical protein
MFFLFCFCGILAMLGAIFSETRLQGGGADSYVTQNFNYLLRFLDCSKAKTFTKRCSKEASSISLHIYETLLLEQLPQFVDFKFCSFWLSSTCSSTNTYLQKK